MRFAAAAVDAAFTAAAMGSCVGEGSAAPGVEPMALLAAEFAAFDATPVAAAPGLLATVLACSAVAAALLAVLAAFSTD